MPPVNTCACSSVDRAPASDAGLSQVRFLSSVPKFAVKIDAICFDRIFTHFSGNFQKSRLNKRQ